MRHNRPVANPVPTPVICARLTLDSPTRGAPRCARAVGTASADCKADCEAAIPAFQTTCTAGAVAAALAGDCTVDANEEMTCTTCPVGCQAEIDNMYAACGGCEDFDTEAAPTMKTTVEAWGCGGAAHVTPAFFVAVAAIANHFLN
eukprot:COSAG03_NODE_1725_length_3599_cov_136.169714_3_plen_146_part_00